MEKCFRQKLAQLLGEKKMMTMIDLNEISLKPDQGYIDFF